MLGRNFGKGIQLETHARVAGGHHAMGNQLVFVAEVAAQAQLGAQGCVGGGVEAMFNIARVAGVGLDMRPDPFFGGAVTGLTGHAIGYLEAIPALVCGNIVRVAIKTNLRLMGGLFQAEIFGDFL